MYLRIFLLDNFTYFCFGLWKTIKSEKLIFLDFWYVHFAGMKVSPSAHANRQSVQKLKRKELGQGVGRRTHELKLIPSFSPLSFYAWYDRGWCVGGSSFFVIVFLVSHVSRPDIVPRTFQGISFWRDWKIILFSRSRDELLNAVLVLISYSPLFGLALLSVQVQKSNHTPHTKDQSAKSPSRIPGFINWTTLLNNITEQQQQQQQQR
jgi:hypothetical protein